MKKILILLLTYLTLTGCSLQSRMTMGGESAKKNHRVSILDERILYYPKKNSIDFSEISDLSYVQKDHKLYLIGDKGNFYIFDAYFDNKIRELKYLKAFKITEEKQHKPYDSEGLSHDKNGQLYISFEGTPRISKISNKGYLREDQKLTEELKNKRNYKSANKMFEALASHPKYGLLTATEYPLHKKDNTQQTIYSLHGKKWSFVAQGHKNNAITAIEVMDDNNLLILERAYSGISKPFVITLSKLYLDQCDRKRQCKSEQLASFNSQKGWAVNNYEGLARVGRNRYIMISDNNNKKFIMTQMIYFKIN